MCDFGFFTNIVYILSLIFLNHDKIERRHSFRALTFHRASWEAKHTRSSTTPITRYQSRIRFHKKYHDCSRLKLFNFFFLIRWRNQSLWILITNAEKLERKVLFPVWDFYFLSHMYIFFRLRKKVAETIYMKNYFRLLMNNLNYIGLLWIS